jgi:2-hydroxymuconate-semialdehyde hydrolase
MNTTTGSTASNPELGRRIRAHGIDTNYHDVGQAREGNKPLLMIHGSGPGVSAWANWRLNMPVLAEQRRVIAPDMVGFGFTERPAGTLWSMDTWVAHAVGVLDALDIAQADVLGNSFGGALALALAIRHPERVGKLILMGACAARFPITDGLDATWGYSPSIENMRSLLDIFAYDRNLVNDELARLRYEASIRPGFQESFGAMFPAPRQRWVDAMSPAEADVRAVAHDTLLIHGRDDKVIPLQASLTLHQWIVRSQLHVFGRCGHWTQIEHTRAFNQLVGNFLDA